MMDVAFRVDASPQIGTGHAMRCLRLAQLLHDRGSSVRFVCRCHDGGLTDLLRGNGLEVIELPALHAAQLSPGGTYADSLGVPEAADAAQTVAALNGSRPDWLVVDHYALGAEWEGLLRPHARRLMVIDDLADRRHDCDVLLDQTLSLAGMHRYDGLVPDGSIRLLGPRHALLAPQYAAARGTRTRTHRQLERVLVFFGGSDAQGLTGLALEALAAPSCAHLRVDVVAGAFNAHRAELQARARARPCTYLHGPTPDLADLMADADLGIGAGGGTMWERMCMGLPAIVVAVAENQRPGCEAAAASGLVDYMGTDAAFSVRELVRRIEACIREPERLALSSDLGRRLVDGLGTRRVAEVLLPSSHASLTLRTVRPDEMGTYYEWVNDPEVRRHSIRSAAIAWDEHCAWFKDTLADRRNHLFVLDAGGLPVGQIRFQQRGQELRLNYSLDALVRGRGWARHLVELGLREMARLGSWRVIADVKEDNVASRAVFSRLGFEESAAAAGPQVRTYWTILRKT